jgi:hypothetical protein
MLKVITGQSDTIEIHVDENDPETVKAMENLIRSQEDKQKQLNNQPRISKYFK